jgi:hypothetical protein
MGIHVPHSWYTALCGMLLLPLLQAFAGHCVHCSLFFLFDSFTSLLVSGTWELNLCSCGTRRALCYRCEVEREAASEHAAALIMNANGLNSECYVLQVLS